MSEILSIDGRHSKTLRELVSARVKFRQVCNVADAYTGRLKKGEVFDWSSDDLSLSSSSKIDNYGISVPVDKVTDDVVDQMTRFPLKENAIKELDRMVHAQLDETPLRVCPGGMGSSDRFVSFSIEGDPSFVNNCLMTKEHVKEISLLMTLNGIRTFVGDDHMAYGRPTSFAGFKDDLEPVHAYSGSGFGHAMNGEMGRIHNVRFVKQTNVPHEQWENEQSDAVFFIGSDAITEAVVTPEEIRALYPTDMGRKKGVMWLYTGGCGLIRQCNEGVAVVKWDSKR